MAVVSVGEVEPPVVAVASGEEVEPPVVPALVVPSVPAVVAIIISDEKWASNAFLFSDSSEKNKTVNLLTSLKLNVVFVVMPVKVTAGSPMGSHPFHT